ncbi:hypothetical protein ACLCDV_06880 [Sphingobacterium sp. Lzh-3]|uniref:Imm32 family immunity protein n=1 Tax=Sphingobacterium sp. Lzh-3 TaxID=3382150 RepID=UPI00398CE83B
MNIEINLPDYADALGLQSSWEEGFEIATKIIADEIVITANRQGLISLAKQLLILAQDDVPIGAHVHLDEINSLEMESVPLILQKV